MPQLNGNAAQNVDKAEVSSGGLITYGDYLLTLVDVKDIPPKEGQEYGQWAWVYQFPEDHPQYARRKITDYCSLHPNAPYNLARNFQAFGVPATTNTDTILQRKAVVTIGEKFKEVKQGGQWVKTTERVNEIKGIAPDPNHTAGAATESPSGLF